MSGLFKRRLPPIITLIIMLQLNACSASDADPNETPPAACGNGKLEEGEHCDGVELDGSSCQKQGYFSGTLRCDTSCQYDTSSCTNSSTISCGNGIREAEEACDGQDIGDATPCANGELPTCDASCSLQCPYAQAPDLVAPSHLSFDRVQPGDQKVRLLELENRGNQPLKLIDLRTDNPNFTIRPQYDYPADQPPWPTQLAPGAHLVLRITFRPTTNTPTADKLTILTNDPDTPRHVIDLLGNHALPCILITEDNVQLPTDEDALHMDFGVINLGSSLSKELIIQNCDKQKPLLIKQLEFSNITLNAFYVTLPATPQLIEAQGQIKLRITYTPREEDEAHAQLLLALDTPELPQFKVRLKGQAVAANCPIARAGGRQKGRQGALEKEVVAINLSTVELSGLGSTSPNGEIERFEWSVVRAPVDATGQLYPSDQTPTTNIFMSHDGEYIVELTVYDQFGIKSCKPARVRAITDVQKHIQIELTSISSNTDIELHYKRRLPNSTSPWSSTSHDIFWRNPTADWGLPGASNNPTINFDLEGGLQTITHNKPNPAEVYDIGVRYLARDSSDTSNPRRVSLIVSFHWGPVYEIKDFELPEGDGFWHLGELTDGSHFTLIDRLSDTPPN